MQQVHVNRGLLTDVLSELKELKKELRKVPSNQQVETSFFISSGITFPINNEEDFNALETFLGNEVEYNKAVSTNGLVSKNICFYLLYYYYNSVNISKPFICRGFICNLSIYFMKVCKLSIIDILSMFILGEGAIEIRRKQHL